MLSHILGAIFSLLTPAAYGSDLEEYINNRNPLSTYDVEKFTLDYERNKDKWL